MEDIVILIGRGYECKSEVAYYIDDDLSFNWKKLYLA